ncbi:MAG: peroxide stress protein YaaA [Pseudomonadales bacterium]
MLMVISPAKTLDFDSPLVSRQKSQPRFLSQSEQLIKQLRPLAPHDVSSLMSISDKLGVLNYDRFQSWQPPFDLNNARQALLAFKGDVYTGMAAETFSADDFKFAQKHLRILSGLYGLLRPMDLIQPYRLEMGTRFENTAGKNLYEFWGDSLTQNMNKDVKGAGDEVLINLASNEYFKAVKPKQLKARVVTPEFRDLKNGQYKMISFYAKKARGMMAAYIIRNRINEPDAIRGFDSAGYVFNEGLSVGDKWVFSRDTPE